jgi:nanoRNase/pAp phosphatase (c-di-AMP/oligoRNAs hydrolase)
MATSKKTSSSLIHFLRKRKREISPLLILTHDHPDPDAIASAMALAYLAKSLGKIRCRIAYGGLVGRMENQTMVRALDIPLNVLKSRTDFKRFKHVALVDTQPPFGNNTFPKDRRATLVVDHHHAVNANPAEHSIVLPDTGATSSIMGDALLRSKQKIPTRLATALLYGILSETQDLGRDTCSLDIQVYQKLLPLADMRILSAIQNPQRPRSFFKILNRSLDRAFVSEHVIGAHLGFVDTPDLVSQTADFLLTYEGTRWSVCTGRFQGKLHISLRGLRPKLHAGKLLREVTRPGEGKTNAGGHRTMAGGAVTLDSPIRESQWKKLEKETAEKLLKKLTRKRQPQLRFPFQIEG